MDSIIDLSNLFILKPIDSYLTDIRLLLIFGCNGEEVIFITSDDHVYGYGRNRFGGLGLGHSQENTPLQRALTERPQLNNNLSGKRVVDIICGYEHWIALTANGRCYGWGHNQFGQLGVGGVDALETPKLIEGLKSETITEVCCGAGHTLALTKIGELFSFGNNKSGQLGNGSKGKRCILT